MRSRLLARSSLVAIAVVARDADGFHGTFRRASKQPHGDDVGPALKLQKFELPTHDSKDGRRRSEVQVRYPCGMS